MDPQTNPALPREAGVLLAISSLPSPFGVGTLGKEAFAFVDFLAAAGQKLWQVLPVNPTAFGDSPYQSPAALSGNPYFIDPALLYEEGLLTEKEVGAARDVSPRVNYGKLFDTRYTLLKKAFSRADRESAEFLAFCRENEAWLTDYALFMALKETHAFSPWYLWEEESKNYDSARALAPEMATELAFWRWVQYVFMKQWNALHRYANEKGIRIIGDMPIYVAHDSMDVWRAREEFLLDADGYPEKIAGCPPDAFTKNGQLWGNPLYRWDKMEREGFPFWIARMRANLALFDLVRIDHFRGFAGYYAIPARDKTAKNGVWEKAPGEKLFSAVKDAFPNAAIIAEDLGFITPDVRELLKKTGFPGMKVLQFAFDAPQSEYLPRNFTTDRAVVYTGSHDSDCTATFVRRLRGERLRRFHLECPVKHGETRTESLIRLALESRAAFAVIPMQDYLGQSSREGRMNTPAEPSGNWTYRLPPDYEKGDLAARMLRLTRASGRSQ